MEIYFRGYYNTIIIEYYNITIYISSIDDKYHRNNNHFGVGYGKSGLQGRTPEEEEEFAKTQEFWGPAKVVPENFPSHHPITSMEELKAFTWPDPNDPELLDPVKDMVDTFGDDYFTICDLSSTLIEAAYAHIVGTQKFFLQIPTNYLFLIARSFFQIV